MPKLRTSAQKLNPDIDVDPQRPAPHGKAKKAAEEFCRRYSALTGIPFTSDGFLHDVCVERMQFLKSDP